jgi:hypothetical protein
MKNYDAPWSTSLIIISSLTTVFCLGIALGMVWNGGGIFPWLAFLPLAIVIGSVPFTIRGYSLTSQAIMVHRLFWTTQLPIIGLQSVQFDPNAMRGSIRTFGNGGMFSFTGFFRNRLLGSYRAFVTDPHQTVVLHYVNRTIVISPATPGEFVRDLGILGLAA